MKVDVDVIINGKIKKTGIEAGTKIKEIAEFYQDEEPYPFFIAKINNMYVSLEEVIHTPCTIELLDGRNYTGHLAYQNSLLLIYNYAVKKVLGDETVVRNENSLAGGMFTFFYGYESVDEKTTQEIEKEMKKIISMNLPIMQRKMGRFEAIEFMQELGFLEKAANLRKTSEVANINCYSIEGHYQFGYTDLLPSTGYIKNFQLVPYEYGIIVRGVSRQDPLKVPEYKEEAELFEAFEKEKEWCRILGIKNTATLNSKIDNNEIKEAILMAEAFTQERINKITEQILDGNKKAIYISGPSSSGKTTFAKRLALQLKVSDKTPVYIGMDDYYVERENMAKDINGEYDFDRGIVNVDLDLFKTQIAELLEGKEVDVPRYDFGTGSKNFGERKEKLTENSVLIIEGVYALEEEVSNNIDNKYKYKIYISPLTQLNLDDFTIISNRDSRLIRRIIRDYYHRHYSAEDTIKIWPKVMVGEERNIFPASKESDIVFNSSLIYELGVLKKYGEPILGEVSIKSSEYGEARRLLEFLSFFKKIEDEMPIGNTSLLREFIGGSVF